MNKYHVLSLVCFIVGLFFFIIGFIYGDIEAGIIVFIPFISCSGIYALVGIIFLMISIVFFMFCFTGFVEYDETNFEGVEKSKKNSVKGGGVVFIGPIPIVFGSSWKIAIVLMIIGFLIMVSLIFLL